MAILALSLLLAACGGGGSDSGSTDSGGDTGGGDSGGDNASSDIEPQTWRFVTEETSGQVQMVYANEFATRINEKSGGAITVETYEFGGLGSEGDQVELLQNGGVEMAIMSPGFTGNMVQEGQIFALHFLFPESVEQTQQILNESEALNTDLVQRYEEYSITPLAFWSEGATMWTSNDVALDEPADFEGFLMRVQDSPLMIRSYEAYGAEPTPMSWGDLYTALDRGTVQGQENPIFFIEDVSFHEVQEYITLSNHNNYVAMTTVNTEWFNGLPENVQTMVQETVDEMQTWVFEEQQAQNDNALEEMQNAEGASIEIVELSDEQRQAFQDLAVDVYDYYRTEVSTVDGQILDKLQSEIEEITGSGSE